MQQNGDALNLTKEQKDLLRLLVEKHESTGGAEFIYVRSSGGAALCYRGPISVTIPYDDTDFNQLQQENLITLIFVDIGQFRGKPTQRGINLVQNGFAPADKALTGLPLGLARTVPRSLDWAPNQIDPPAPKQPQTFAEFLASFPKAVGAAVEAEQIRAERAFVAGQTAPAHGKLEELARAYIMRVFLAFARAICKLGLIGQFEIRKIEATGRRFLRLLAAEVYRDKVWCNRDALGKSMLINSELFKEKLESFEKTPEWGQYQMTPAISGSCSAARMTRHFATGCWHCRSPHRCLARPTGVGQMWRKSSTPAFMPSGTFYAARELSAKAAQLVREYRQEVRSQSF
jgi:hypothetical protein